LRCFHVYMYYNSNWFISIFLHTTLVLFLRCFQPQNLKLLLESLSWYYWEKKIHQTWANLRIPWEFCFLICNSECLSIYLTELAQSLSGTKMFGTRKEPPFPPLYTVSSMPWSWFFC
jgi:hypothetical protein